MKDLTLEQRQALKITEYILGERGGLLDEEINGESSGLLEIRGRYNRL